MIVDRFGNELKMGDQVIIVPDKALVFGRIIALAPGNVMMVTNPTEKPKKAPDIMVVACEYMMDPPYNGNIHKVYGIPIKGAN